MKGYIHAQSATGGKQYKVAKDDVIAVEADAQVGDKVKLDVLMLNDGKKTIVDSKRFLLKR